jgi:hypothetical protein
LRENLEVDGSKGRIIDTLKKENKKNERSDREPAQY